MEATFSYGEGRAFLGHEQCAANHRFGPAIRDGFLLHFIIKGRGRLQTEQGEYLLDAGDGFFILPGEVTTYTADPADPWEYLWVGVAANKENEAALRRHGLEAGVHCFVYQDKDEVIPYLKRMTADTTLYNYDRALGAFYLLLSIVTPLQQSVLAKGDHYLQMCYDYMENAYSDCLTVESLATHLNVSRSYLYRIFKSGLGISPQRAILNFRLEKAALLVEKGGVSLTEIAISCGFCDLSHFSKAYKERYHRRPKAMQGKSSE